MGYITTVIQVPFLCTRVRVTVLSGLLIYKYYTMRRIPMKYNKFEKECHMNNLEDYLPGVRGKMKMMAARVSDYTHSVLSILVEIGMFDSKSDAIRAAMDIGIMDLQSYCPSLYEFTRCVRTFDKEYWPIMSDIEKVAALVQKIDDICAPLKEAGLSWTLFDIEKKGSAYLPLARLEIADRDLSVPPMHRVPVHLLPMRREQGCK